MPPLVVVSLLMQPWYILENFGNYIFLWLGTYGALLGPIDGIAIADYWLVRKRRIHLTELYKTNGIYSYKTGFNTRAIWAMLIGIAIPFISKLIPGLEIIWDNAWTIGLLISLALYTWMMKGDSTIMSEVRQLFVRKDNQESNGIGLRNVDQRIVMSYGPEYGIQIESQEGSYTRIIMTLPYRVMMGGRMDIYD